MVDIVLQDDSFRKLLQEVQVLESGGRLLSFFSASLPLVSRSLEVKLAVHLQLTRKEVVHHNQPDILVERQKKQYVITRGPVPGLCPGSQSPKVIATTNKTISKIEEKMNYCADSNFYSKDKILSKCFPSVIFHFKACRSFWFIESRILI